MYGKFNEDGKFVAAPGVKKVTHEGNKTIIERYSEEELDAMGYKKVIDQKGEGKPANGAKEGSALRLQFDLLNQAQIHIHCVFLLKCFRIRAKARLYHAQARIKRAVRPRISY